MNGIDVVMPNIVKMIMIAYEALVVKRVVVTMMWSVVVFKKTLKSIFEIGYQDLAIIFKMNLWQKIETFQSLLQTFII